LSAAEGNRLAGPGRDRHPAVVVGIGEIAKIGNKNRQFCPES